MDPKESLKWLSVIVIVFFFIHLLAVFMPACLEYQNTLLKYEEAFSANVHGMPWLVSMEQAQASKDLAFNSLLTTTLISVVLLLLFIGITSADRKVNR